MPRTGRGRSQYGARSKFPKGTSAQFRVLAKHLEIFWATFHRMDELFATLVPDQHHEFEQPTLAVKAETEKLCVGLHRPMEQIAAATLPPLSHLQS